jgi:hypothetical protein
MLPTAPAGPTATHVLVSSIVCIIDHLLVVRAPAYDARMY